MRLWITIALVALLAALLWLTGGQTRADAPPEAAAIVETTTLRYETYDLTGRAATAGSYAFLADQGGATSAVATYEGLRDGTAQRLLIHKTDAQGTSRATLYDAVAAGDLFEWRQSYDCWVRYEVTEVKPDPPGAAPRKQLAVERTSYAFSGCTGAIAAEAAVLLAWGALPDLGGPTLAAPLRHGPFQIVPEDWERPIEEDPYRPWPRNSYTNPVRTTDLTEARRLSHWRDPTLPSGWTLVWASSGDYYSDPPDGYCSWWATDRGYGGVELCGGFYPVQDRPRESSESSGAAVVETRMIAGRPAIVEYSPAGPNHNPYVAVRVLVSDPILDVVYHVRGLDGTLRGDRVDAGIAIARSLFEGADEATAVTQGAAGPGESPAPFATPKPLFEWWADGRPTSPPLDLKLRSSRELCTAGTLTEISWEISGGVAPYQLSIEGAAVDVDANNIRINCGALTEAEAGDAEVALAAKTVSAVVTDSRGVQRQAALEVARARALPAPSYVNTNVQQTLIALYWSVDDGVRGTDGTARYLVRSRPTGQSVWNYIHEERSDSRKRTAAGIRGLSEGAAYEAQVAAMRDPLEGLTPAVLTWSATETATTAKAPTGVRATATHDTVTVVWDAQPSVDYYYIRLVERGSQGPGRYESINASPTAIREVTFRRLDAATNYTVTVSVDGDVWSRLKTDVDITTAQAPANWAPSERSPVIIKTHATHDTIEVSWTAPPAGARLFYLVSVEHPASPYVHAEWVDGGTAFSLDRLAPETTYTVHVHHHDLHGGTATVEITTLPSPVRGVGDTIATTQGRAGSSEPSTPSAQLLPLFEWWADGRPTSPPLDLKLESSRELCTAGTLTEITWQISGGVAPYKLSIESEAVNADAKSVRVNCGALTEAEAGDEEAPLAAKTVSAVVTDSRGVQRQAALEVARARALPAPTAVVRVYPSPHAISFEWLGARGSAPCDAAAPFAVRWRRSGATGWSYGLYQSGSHDACKVWRSISGLQEGAAYEASIAALRAPIELESPEALQWTNAARGATATTPSGVVVSSTHDSVRVRWNRQPSAYHYVVSLAGPNGGRSMRLWRDQDESAWGDAASGIHEVVFRHLPPNTAFVAYVAIPTTVHEKRLVAETQVRTKAAPATWTPLPRGAQNLRATATADGITVRWDAPFVGADDWYKVTVYHPRYPSKPLLKWVYRTEFSQSGLEAGLTYRVVVEHQGIVRAAAEIEVTTAASTAAGLGESPAPLTTPGPLFEWWADGRPASPPLHLTLRSSRELCTAGTLTEISWTISGGVAPYELSIEGAAVDVDADNVRVNCGALSEAEAGDAEAALAAKTVTATVTDSRGVQRQAALEVQRARALPAPHFWLDSHPSEIAVLWRESQIAPFSTTAAAGGIFYVIRYRPTTSSDWQYTATYEFPAARIAIDPGPHIVQIAAVRAPIEQRTPAALRWAAEMRIATPTAPQNIIATPTHDTVTVSWDRQPLVQGSGYVVLSPSDGGPGITRRFTETGANGRHVVVFERLPADTDLSVRVVYRSPDREFVSAATNVRTGAAPTGWTPPPRGPQNLRATTTGNSITVRWDAPAANAEPHYLVQILNAVDSTEVDSKWIHDGATQWVSYGSFRQIQPSTEYRVLVVHLALPRVEAAVSVTTTASGPTGSSDNQDTAAPGGLDPWERIWAVAFRPIWPS